MFTPEDNPEAQIHNKKIRKQEKLLWYFIAIVSNVMAQWNLPTRKLSDRLL